MLWGPRMQDGLHTSFVSKLRFDRRPVMECVSRKWSRLENFWCFKFLHFLEGWLAFKNICTMWKFPARFRVQCMCPVLMIIIVLIALLKNWITTVGNLNWSVFVTLCGKSRSDQSRVVHTAWIVCYTTWLIHVVECNYTPLGFKVKLLLVGHRQICYPCVSKGCVTGNQAERCGLCRLGGLLKSFCDYGRTGT